MVRSLSNRERASRSEEARAESVSTLCHSRSMNALFLATDVERMTDARFWRVIEGKLHARFTTDDFVTGLAFVNLVGRAAEEADHHPDIELRYATVHVALISHDAHGLTERDVSMARTIGGIADQLGISADTASLQRVSIAIDTIDESAIRPFWMAVLGYAEDTEDLIDPAGSGPDLWFQQMDEPRTERNRIHLDILVAADQAELRVAEALAAGGSLVTDKYAPSWWVLADAEGNEACICTYEESTHEPPTEGTA